jgi:hypothetical protein
VERIIPAGMAYVGSRTRGFDSRYLGLLPIQPSSGWSASCDRGG